MKIMHIGDNKKFDYDMILKTKLYELGQFNKLSLIIIYIKASYYIFGIKNKPLIIKIVGFYDVSII